MAVTFIYGEALGPDDLRIEIRDEAGALIDPYRITYAFWYNNPLYSKQMWGQAGRAPQRLSQGFYYAVESINSSYPTGDYIIEWSIKRTSLSPTEIVRNEFAIMATSPYPIAAAVPPCSGCGSCDCGGCSGNCPTTLDGLDDVTIGVLTNGQFLRYNDSLGVWTNVTLNFGTAAFLDAGTQAGQVLLLAQSNKLPALDGSNLTALGSIDLHSDVDIAGIVNGQTLVWNNALGMFVPGNGGGGGGDADTVFLALQTGPHTGITFVYDNVNQTISGTVQVSILDADIQNDYAPVNGIDTTFNALANGQVLVYNLGQGKFVNDLIPASSIDGLGTAAFADLGIAEGNVPVLGANGLPAVGGFNLIALGSIGLHSDVSIGVPTPLATGQTLRYNFTLGVWQNKQLSLYDLSDSDIVATEDWVIQQIQLAGGYTDAQAIAAVHGALTSTTMNFNLINGGTTIQVVLDAGLSDLNDVVFVPDVSKDGYVLTYKHGVGGWRGEAITYPPLDLSAVAQNIIPSVTNFWDIGQVDKIWRRIYLGGANGLYLGDAAFSTTLGGDIQYTFGLNTYTLATLDDIAAAYTDEQAIAAVGSVLALGPNTGISFFFNPVGNTITATVTPLALDDLTDAGYAGARQEGQVVRYNNVAGEWRNAFLSVNDLSDSADVLTINNIENYLDNNIGLDNLNDVTIPVIPLAEGQVLRYNLANTQWENAKLNLSDLDGAITGQLVYRGGYNPNTNTPDVSSAVSGDFYVITADGTLFGEDVFEGDFIIFKQDAGGVFDASDIDIIHNQAGVQSVNGLTGVVTLTTQNVNELVNLYFTPLRAVTAVGNNLVANNGSNVGITFSFDGGFGNITAEVDLALGELNDVNAPAPNNGDYLVFNGGVWSNQALSLGSFNLNDLNDVEITAPFSNNNVLKYDGGIWKNTSLAVGDVSGIVGVYALINSPTFTGIPQAPLPDGSVEEQIATVKYVSDSIQALTEGLDWLTDVTITPPLETGEVLRYNAVSSQWENSQLFINDLFDVNAVGLLDRKVLLYSQVDAEWQADYLDILDIQGNEDLARLDSPAFTGIPTADTAAGGTSTNQLATTAFVTQAVQDVIGADGLFLRRANNLSDLTIVADARDNLGLGTVATLDTGTTNGTVPVLTANGLPAVGGSDLTSLPSLDTHSNVNVAGAVAGDFLYYDGAEWIPASDALTVVNGVDISSTPVDLSLGGTLVLEPGDNVRVLHNGDGVFTFTLTDTVIINESLVVAGNSFEADSVKFKDALILLGNGNVSTTNHVGYFGQYRRAGQGATTFTSGLLYDPVIRKFNLFSDMVGIDSTDQTIAVSDSDRADLNVKGLDTSGSVTNLVTNAVAATVTLDEHHVYLANAGDTVTLPASIDGRRYFIKRKSGVGGNVVINTTGGQTIEGLTTRSITAEYGYVEVIGDGTEWYILGSKNLT